MHDGMYFNTKTLPNVTCLLVYYCMYDLKSILSWHLHGHVDYLPPEASNVYKYPMFRSSMTQILPSANRK